MSGAVASVVAGLACGTQAAGFVSFPKGNETGALEDGSSETLRVNARREAAEARIRFNQGLTEDLIHGRVELWAAAGKFVTGCDDDFGQRTVLETMFPGPTLEASAGANLIVRVHNRLGNDPRRERLIRELLAKYQERYGEPNKQWLKYLEAVNAVAIP